MTAPEDDYSRRLHAPSATDRYYPPPSPNAAAAAAVAAAAAADRFWAHTLPHQHHYERERPPAPAPLPDRYLLSPSPDRYSPAPGSTPIERYVPPPAPGPAERYSSSSTSSTTNATPGGPGDPYMRRDLGYHHHYRLSTGYYQPQYHTMRHAATTPPPIPPLPHRYNHHHVITPVQHGSRGLQHIRCCPSPSGSVRGTSSADLSGVVLPDEPLMRSRRERERDCCQGGPGGRRYSKPLTLPSPGVATQTGPERPDSRLSTRERRESKDSRDSRDSRDARETDIPPPTTWRNLASSQPPLPLQQLPSVGAPSSQVQQQQQQASASPPSPTPSSATTATLSGGSAAVAIAATSSAVPSPAAAVPGPASGLSHPLSVLRSQSVPVGPGPTPPSSASVVGDAPSGASSISSSAPHTMSTTASSLGDGGSPLLAPSAQVAGTASGSSHHPPPHRTVSLDDSARRRPQSVPGAGAANRRQRLQRQQSRTEMVKSFIKRETAAFFGVDDDQEAQQKVRWEDRRRRHAARKLGDLKAEYMTPATTPTAESGIMFGQGSSGMAVNRKGLVRSVSSAYPQATRPDIVPPGFGGMDVQDSTRWSEPPVRRKETVARMTFTGLAYVISALTSNRPRPTSLGHQHSRSYQPSAVPDDDSIPTAASSPLVNNELFFDRPTPETRVLLSGPEGDGVGATATEAGAVSDQTDSGPPPGLGEMQIDGGGFKGRDHQGSAYIPDRDRARSDSDRFSTRDSWKTRAGSHSEMKRGAGVGLDRIPKSWLEKAFDNSDRRQYGMGVLGRLCGRSLNGSVVNHPEVKEKLDDIEDHRPFFTYWVTTVQILILVISLASYGFGPVGFSLHERSGLVLVTSLSLQQVDFTEPANFWVGPRAADLIHLGAKFAPCMRKDAKIIKEIEKGREKERETACCIRNDDSGCVQRTRSECSTVIEKWTKDDNSPGGRISGPVCGLDPKYCDAPRSTPPFEWPSDITKWPICRKTNPRYPSQPRFQLKDNKRNNVIPAEHMACEVIGHPCCIGIHGACSITTKEYCEFVHGYFHEEASLCSQVSCLDDVCGMIPFYSPEVPDQFYRLWTSLFLHAGLLHLTITVFIQYFLMRDLEKLTGSLRISIIYIGSGVAGNLASAIFVPYRAEVGPAGSQFGLLACLIVEVLNAWRMLRRPGHALMRLVGITALLFLLGLLPWVDNYAHLFGFIFGFLLSYALLPFITIGEYDMKRKIALIWVCLLASSFMFATLVALFYIIPVYDCEVCKYFNCLPLTKDFCATQNIILRKHDSV